MRYLDRVMIGMLFVFGAIFALWYGSPARAGALDPDPMYSIAFVILFAIGFIIGTMGLLGAEGDYPALLSSFVLYFLVGALFAVYLYVTESGVGLWTLDDADSSAFWSYWMKVVATWPLQIVGQLGLMGYAPL